MQKKLQEAIDSVSADAGYEAILLGYARCNDGVVGLRARALPLVIPRAHDCITLFFGSRHAFHTYFDQHPGTYYLTTGWLERNDFTPASYARPAYGIRGVMERLGLSEPYEVMVERYGKENADYIVETLGGWLRAYSHCLYLEMGVCDERPFIAQAHRKAQEHGWEMVRRKGDWTLLRKLFFGEWDEDFVVVPPGGELAAESSEGILTVCPPNG